MPLPVIQPSFAAGEISPQLFSHIDLAKIHIGAALMRNFLVDYRGGASNRQGTKFVARAKDSNNPVRMIPFTFNILQAYMLEFGHQYMRVIMNGAPVLDLVRPVVGATQANPGVLNTGVGHGLHTGETVFITGVTGMTQLNGRTFLAVVVLFNTLSLTDLDGVPVDTTAYGAFTGGGTVQRVYTLNTPYVGGDLALIKFAQNADVMTITHPNYKTQVLTRTGHAAWTMVPLAFNPQISAPTVPTCVNTPGGGATTYRYVITALSPDFRQESLPSAPVVTAVAPTMSTTPGSYNTVGCAVVPGAGGYNFYRQLEVPGAAPSTGSIYGFVGTSLTNSFVDHNLVPNFSLTPPQGNDPFSHGSIVSVPVTAGGAGYLPVPDTIITAMDVTGAGAALVPTIVAGVITAVNVNNGGNNYAAPTFAASTTVGTGADIVMAAKGAGPNFPVIALTINNGGNGYASNITGSLTDWPAFTCTFTVDQNGTIIAYNITNGGILAGPGNLQVIVNQAQVGAGAIFGAAVLSNVGNNPGCVTYFQQRQIFGGSNPRPQDLWMSRSNDYFNMNFSSPARDDDAVFTTLVSREVNAIKWLVPMKSLIVLTGKNAWRVDGGVQSSVITPTRINADPESFNGAADVPPLTINYDILYVQNKGSVVRDLSYNFYTNIYTGADLTVLANHLVKGRRIVEWAWAEEPQKIVWSIRDDGVLLSLTYLKEQDVYGWAKHDTLGAFQSVATITEGQEDAVYFVVSRLIGGKYVKYIERLASRNFDDDVTGAWFVDSGLQFPLTFLAATATPSSGWRDAGQQTIVISTNVAVFTAPMVGNQIRMNGGVGVITVFTDAQHVTVKLSHPMNNVFPALPNAWSCTAPVASVGGLWHLIGATVTGLSDGSVITPRVVAANATIALDQAGFPSVVGLGYRGQLQSLYANDGGQLTIQGRRKNIPAVTARVHNSRGLKCGPDFEHMYEFKERTEIPYLLPAPVGQVDQSRISIGTNLGDAIPLQSTDERMNVDSDWTVPGQVCFQQDYPLPTTITGIIPELDVGDTPSA